jgi:type I restriction enzyme S subunit
MAGEWPQQPLEEVAELSGGFAFKSEDYSQAGRFVLRTLNIKDDGSIHRDDAVYLPLEKCDLYKRFELREHDTLFVMVGATLGKVGYVRRETLPALLNQNMWRIRGRDGLCDKRYLQYAFRHTVVKNLGWASGSARDFVRRDDYRTMEIPVPPLAEQKAIAAVLGALDDKIELNRRMNATLEAMARALFQSWFVDFDPVRAKLDGRPPAALDPATAALFPDSFQDSEAGHIPKGWEVKTLSDLTSLITKGTTPTQNDMTGAPTSDAQINYVRVNSIDEDGSVLADKLTTIPESVHAVVLKRSVLMENDVLYTIAGTIGRIAVAEDWLLPANTNQAVAIIRPEPEIPSGFLVLTMRHEAFREELHNNIVHAVQANLSLGMLSKARVVVPPHSILKQIFRPIDTLLSQISANRAQSRTLATLRDTLLPKLLSGEISIPQPNRSL